MLCLASLSLFAACLTYPVLVAVGRVRDTLVSSLISLAPSLLVICVASFFGVRAVAASALLTLPFQAAVVAIYFIGRHLAIGGADLVRATLKSGIVTACSLTGVMIVVAINGFSLAVPMVGCVGASIAGLVAWCLGLAITRHSLLAQMRMAAGGVPIVMPRLPSSRRAEAIRSEARSA
jgi:hypothetical protein